MQVGQAPNPPQENEKPLHALRAWLVAERILFVADELDYGTLKQYLLSEGIVKFHPLEDGESEPFVRGNDFYASTFGGRARHSALKRFAPRSDARLLNVPLFISCPNRDERLRISPPE